MSREWTFRVGSSTVMPEKHRPFPREWMDHHKLYAAIDIARDMVSAAREQLGLLRGDLAPQAAQGGNQPFKWTQTGGAGMVHSWTRDERRKDTIRTLAKYFSMEPSSRDYVANIGTIIEVYEKIAVGLSNNLEIVVFNPVARKDWQDISKPTTARGFVPTQKPENKEDYKNFLEMKRELVSMGDDGPHRYWGKLGAGKIHLSLSLFVDGGHENGADAIARTLVHEASHKFANTKDHLYKHQSFLYAEGGESVTADGNAMIGVGPSSLAKRGVTYQHGKAVSRGPVLQMVGEVKKPGTNELIAVTETNKFIDNADSYAWAARRIWKRYR